MTSAEIQAILISVAQFILDPEPTPWFLAIKFIFLSINLFMIGFIVFGLINTSWIQNLVVKDLIEFSTYRHFAASKIDKQWENIKAKMATGKESEAKLALIEADTILEEVLTKQGYLGETLDEKLQKINTDVLKVLPNVKEAHKMVSNIVHDPSYRLDMKEAEESISIYKEAFIELQVL